LNRVVRGCGRWDGFARFCRSSVRASFNPDDDDANIGFRVVLSPDQP
jgi:formylglycine-generating enzyme required for sulfatase activity